MALTALTGESAQVEQFSPQGLVKEVRQVSARFSKPMVPFGDPRLEDPFIIQCAVKGKGRWVDDKTWSFDFEKDLPAGLVCRFHLKPEVKTLTGEAIKDPGAFSFNTGGPSVTHSRPEEGDERIDENQMFILFLDTEPDETSVLEKVFFSVEGLQEQVGLRLIKGAEQEQLLKALKIKPPKAVLLVFQARQTFPPNAEVKLVWGKGVKSVSGIPNAVDQVLAFKTRRPFSAKLIGRKEKPSAGYIPLLPLKLSFSAPIAWEKAEQIRLKSESGKIWKPRAEGDGSINYVDRVIFQGPFPENQSLTLHLPKNIRDDSGRPLTNQDKFPLLIKTDRAPSLAKFASRFGIIELHEGALLPLTVRNLEAEITALVTGNGNRQPLKEEKTRAFDQALKSEGRINPPSPGSPEKESPGMDKGLKGKIHQIGKGEEEKIIGWLNRLRTAKRTEPLLKDQDSLQKLSIPKPGGSKEFEVIGIPLKGPGFFLVELESKILGSRLLAKPAPMFVPAAALVTNLSAHFKWGRESSLVWVTTLDQGDPVPGASVTIRDCAGKKVWEGTTDDIGLARINKALPLPANLRNCADKQEEEEYTPALSGIRGGLFVFAKKGDDLTFIHSSWNQGIEPWRFNISGGLYSDTDRFLTHTVFDRTLFRAGEDVHMKHFIRRPSINGLLVPQEKGAFNEVVIEKVGSDQQYFFPLKWRPNGTAETVFKIPNQSKLGTYEVYYSTKTRDKAGQRVLGGSFRVEEFRVPLMRATIQGPKDPVIQTGEIAVDVSVSYLSGGGAALLPVKLRSELQPLAVHFPDYEDIIFSNGPIKPGIQKSESYQEEAYEEEEGEREPGSREKKGTFQTMALTLDKQGGARTKLAGLPETDRPQNILAELEFKDPNGEIQTVSSRIPRYPSSRLVGLHLGIKEPSATALHFQVVVLDLKGRPLPQAEVKTRLFQRKIFSHRRRLSGGFYAYENINQIKEIGPLCQGRTDQRGVLSCEGKSPVSGQVIIQAETIDEHNQVALAHQEIWIPGKEDQWVEVGNDDRMDLIPDTRHVESGEKIRFQVKMPFKEATSLITVEREGILEAYVRKLSRANPFFEIPVQDHYAPNVFVSALVVRGRLPQTRPTAMFDPGKPAYKLGLTEIQVGWKPHELKVEVVPDKKIYRPRETVTARITVKTARGEVPPRGSEVLIAVVDEGLLELKPNESWKLLEAMMKRKGCEVETATAQMMVIGKRHFGRKALAHGGGGGRQLTRELFDTLIYWQGVVALDESGQALVTFPLKDSLTSFRIVAVANGGPGFFGTGDSSIRATQDLMILAGIPPLVRENDRFLAGFTLRNASPKAMTLEAGLTVREIPGGKPFEPLQAHLTAGEAREIGWEITVPPGMEKLNYTVEIKAIDGTAYDRLNISQKVTKAVPLRTYQATMSRIEGPWNLEVNQPAGALAGTGGLSLLLKPRIADGLAGLTEYLKNYPYTCLEQKISKAIVFQDQEIWHSLMAELPSYLDDSGLAKYFPVMHRGSDTLTAYVLAVSQEAGQEIPLPLKNKMINGLTDFIEGKVTRYSSLPTADLSIRKMAAIEALSRYGPLEPGLLSTLAIEPHLWPTSALLDLINTLERAKAIPDRLNRRKAAEQILRSRINLQGTTMGLSTEKTDNLWWLMATPDTNAVKTLLTVLPLDGFKVDLPRMVTGLVHRMKKGHWDTTMANAWGMLALKKFSTLYESLPVAGLTEATMNGKAVSLDWNKTPKGREIHLPWPGKRAILTISHNGSGHPWATVQNVAAIPLKQPFSSGFGIIKTLIPVERKSKNSWTKGDVVRVRLELESQADMTWVAVNDPIPAGSIILGSGLGRDSSLMTNHEQERGRAWETFRERSFEGLKIYYEYVPKGPWMVEYTLRLNNEGTFHLPETRIEALYAPEMFGALPNKPMEVGK
jgi:hypothetical protein